jgi:Rad52/22 family double-strand break repair protein
MTNEDKKKIYAALAAPFPEACIQRTEGRITGRGYDTTGIGYQFICNRLNEVLGIGGWRAHRTVTVKEITTAKGRPAHEAICDLTLELGFWENGQFSVFAESLSDGGHTSTSEADARKGAYTNALKKAAAMFGCGRQAYEGTLDDDNLPNESTLEHGQPPVTITTLPTQATQKPSQAPPPQPLASSTASRAPVASRNRLTSKQLAAIWAIGRKIGYEQQSLRQHIKTTFGVQPEFLSRDQASQAIGALSKQAGNGHAEEFERQPGEEG